ncbi:MAG: septum site-determining protein MinD [Bacilli bacterium]|nr:septum site-determining protein MinD [Bacilli bacterium]
MGETIAITSGKGGVGKSNICLNVGVALAKKGYKVCMVDMDLGLKNLDVLMGLENRVIYDLSDVMNSNCSLKQAMIKDKRLNNLFLIPACKSVHIEKVKSEDIQKVVAHLQTQFDYVLLDSPAGLESGFMKSIACVDKVFVVATLDYTSLQDADRVIGVLMKEGIEEIHLILNKVNPRYIEKGISVSIQEALSYLAINLLGIVYDDENIIRHNNKGYPAAFDEDSMVYDCFNVITSRLEGAKVDLPKYRGKSFMQRVFG